MKLAIVRFCLSLLVFSSWAHANSSSYTTSTPAYVFSSNSAFGCSSCSLITTASSLQGTESYTPSSTTSSSTTVSSATDSSTSSSTTSSGSTTGIASTVADQVGSQHSAISAHNNGEGSSSTLTAFASALSSVPSKSDSDDTTTITVATETITSSILPAQLIVVTSSSAVNVTGVSVFPAIASAISAFIDGSDTAASFVTSYYTSSSFKTFVSTYVAFNTSSGSSTYKTTYTAGSTNSTGGYGKKWNIATSQASLPFTYTVTVNNCYASASVPISSIPSSALELALGSSVVFPSTLFPSSTSFPNFSSILSTSTFSFDETVKSSSEATPFGTTAEFDISTGGANHRIGRIEITGVLGIIFTALLSIIM